MLILHPRDTSNPVVTDCETDDREQPQTIKVQAGFLDQTFSAGKKKKNGRHVSGWAYRTLVNLSLKNGVVIWTFERKNE